MKYSELCCIAALAIAPLTSNAADGTIYFTGSVVSPGCVVTARATPAEIRVTLPPVATGTLAEAGRTAGRTPFYINLAGCDAGADQVRTYFEPGPTVNLSTNNLTLEPGPETAGNVELQLLNGDYSRIRLGNPSELQNSQPITITDDGEASLRYYAEYVATGKATAGSANSSVMFTMVYR
ncbi:fimbrial protein [Luteimonas panaciterrae]|uniref:fimbrial protein n=1 Tax=Luteimonas panaciterrae TaxID=363885 RepID=UPI001CF9B883|nr:fimbrial protein [Luteimonas panaciterrae]